MRYQVRVSFFLPFLDENVENLSLRSGFSFDDSKYSLVRTFYTKM